MCNLPVYLVDGDPAIRDSLTTLLDLNGYRTRAFATGEAFIRALGDDPQIQCVICEAELPDTSGIDVYQRLVTLGVSQPFALLVSHRAPLTRRSAKAAGIEQIFQKPLVHQHLLGFVAES